MNTIEFLIVGLPVWVAWGFWFWEAHKSLHAKREKGES